MSGELTFGECEGLCGGQVERVGWDRYCFACQDEMKREDEECWEQIDEEDRFLYAVPACEVLGDRQAKDSGEPQSGSCAGDA